MTVEKLIEELLKVEDKTLEVEKCIITWEFTSYSSIDYIKVEENDDYPKRKLVVALC